MVEDLSVHELLVQLKHGNIDASGVLFARYARKFYAHARKRGLTHEDADEVAQQVFDNILEGGIDKYNEVNGGGASWMWRICNNLIVDAIRIRRGINSPISLSNVVDEPFAPDDANPIVWLEDKERYAARYCAWKRTSQPDQDILPQKKKSGPRRKEWIAAKERFDAAFEDCLKHPQ